MFDRSCAQRRALLLALAAWPATWLAAMEAPARLRRWGSGEFRRFGFLVYEATLWAGDDPQRPPLMLRLDYKRNIAGAAIAEASVKEMRRTVSDETRLRDWGRRMARTFPDVQPGDHIVGHYRPDGAVFMQEERLLGRIDEPEFAQAFFGIWLDPRTSAPELRAALLRPAEPRS
jgi:hypothetical protein